MLVEVVQVLLLTIVVVVVFIVVIVIVVVVVVVISLLYNCEIPRYTTLHHITPLLSFLHYIPSHHIQAPLSAPVSSKTRLA
jgi:hypothetical protein